MTATGKALSDTAASNRRWLSHAGLVVRLAITVGCLWWIWSKIDPAALLKSFVESDKTLIAAAALLLFALTALRCVRWRIILRRLDGYISFFRGWGLVLIGEVFSQALPSTVGGDAIRGWLAYRMGLGVRTAASSVLLDRVAALTAILLMALAAYPLLSGLEAPADAAAAVALFSFACLLVVALAVLAGRRIAAMLPFGASRLFAPLAEDLSRLARSLWSLLSSLALSVLIVVGVVGAVALLARAVSVDIALLTLCALMPPVLMVTAIPVSIAGWGVRETAMAVSFGWVGVSVADATVISVLFGVCIIIASLPGAPIWVLFKATKPPQGDDREPDGTKRG